MTDTITAIKQLMNISEPFKNQMIQIASVNFEAQGDKALGIAMEMMQDNLKAGRPLFSALVVPASTCYDFAEEIHDLQARIKDMTEDIEAKNNELYWAQRKIKALKIAGAIMQNRDKHNEWDISYAQTVLTFSLDDPACEPIVAYLADKLG